MLHLLLGAAQVALRWFCSRSLLRHEGLARELIDRIPGKQTDRKTPLGELRMQAPASPPQAVGAPQRLPAPACPTPVRCKRTLL